MVYSKEQILYINPAGEQIIGEDAETIKQSTKEKAILKGLAGKSKIVRNKMEEQESSLEMIPLKKDKPDISKSPQKIIKEEEKVIGKYLYNIYFCIIPD